MSKPTEEVRVFESDERMGMAESRASPETGTPPAITIRNYDIGKALEAAAERFKLGRGAQSQMAPDAPCPSCGQSGPHEKADPRCPARGRPLK